MDVVSHGLIGVLCAMLAGLRTWRSRCTMGLVAALPDLPTGIVYLLLGHEKGRQFWIPHNSDWEGVRATHPGWSALWEVPHSLLFLCFVVVPVVLLLKAPLISIGAYFSHIFVDAWTHTGEWALAPLYPLPWRLVGLTDAWAWDPTWWVACWVVLGGVVLWLHRRQQQLPISEIGAARK